VIPDHELTWRFSGSGGPGGQHANTANTRVEVTFDIVAARSLDERTRARLLARFGPRVRVVSTATRSQTRNRELARALLERRLSDALRSPRARRPTSASRASRERRLEAKRHQSRRKADRRRPHHDE
jgi:ribosome-associated protein